MLKSGALVGLTEDKEGRFLYEKEDTKRNPWTYHRAAGYFGNSDKWKYHKRYGHRKFRKLLRDKHTLQESAAVLIPHSELIDPYCSSRDCDSFNRRVIYPLGDTCQKQGRVTDARRIQSYKHKQRKMYNATRDEREDETSDKKWIDPDRQGLCVTNEQATDTEEEEE